MKIWGRLNSLNALKHLFIQGAEMVILDGLNLELILLRCLNRAPKKERDGKPMHQRFQPRGAPWMGI